MHTYISYLVYIYRISALYLNYTHTFIYKVTYDWVWRSKFVYVCVERKVLSRAQIYPFQPAEFYQLELINDRTETPKTSSGQWDNLTHSPC